MRLPALVIGIALLIIGGLIAAGVISFEKEETVAKIGPLEMTATRHKKPAPVIGYVLLGAGALTLVFGLTSKR